MSTFLEQEIHSQPEVIARLLEREHTRVGRIVADLPPFEHVLIAARGTSDHAAIYAKYAWASLAGYPVGLATPALYTLYHTPPRLAHTLIVGISQSGQSPDIVAVLEEGKRQGRPTLAITNDGASPLARVADHVIELHAGPERSVAATKTYTAQLTVLAMLAAAWSRRPEHQAALQLLPAALAATLAGTPAIAALAQRHRMVEQYSLIGRGFNFATALELSLKLKELTYVMTAAYSSADFRHGPIATPADAAGDAARRNIRRHGRSSWQPEGQRRRAADHLRRRRGRALRRCADADRRQPARMAQPDRRDRAGAGAGATPGGRTWRRPRPATRAEEGDADALVISAMLSEIAGNPGGAHALPRTAAWSLTDRTYAVGVFACGSMARVCSSVFGCARVARKPNTHMMPYRAAEGRIARDAGDRVRRVTERQPEKGATHCQKKVNMIAGLFGQPLSAAGPPDERGVYPCK